MSIKNPCVVIVDDTFFNVEVLEGITLDIRPDCIIHKFFNPMDALETIQREETQIDVLLVDINMPVMDGYELSKRLKELPACENSKFVACSAGVLEPNWRETFDDQLAKPVQKDELMRFLI